MANYGKENVIQSTRLFFQWILERSALQQLQGFILIKGTTEIKILSNIVLELDNKIWKDRHTYSAPQYSSIVPYNIQCNVSLIPLIYVVYFSIQIGPSNSNSKLKRIDKSDL